MRRRNSGSSYRSSTTNGHELIVINHIVLSTVQVSQLFQHFTPDLIVE